ncbi:uncharacterized protein LOC121047832 [Ixodes scapularis]|uniref:uncharacterized protein LOC121047832 n=1 Tax=Ixodes scapularis TaxID=6945 RepID=UPI001AD6865B|nr:uncharacterized protein LOC121047832 [Ixodes scapularis]
MRRRILWITLATAGPHVSLLSRTRPRSTPLKNSYSPADLLMGRRLRTKLPIVPEMLMPHMPDMRKLRDFEELYRENQKKDFNRRHGVRTLPEVLNGDEVWITDIKQKGTVQRPAEEPRSYFLDTDNGVVRRNRIHLVPFPANVREAEVVDSEDAQEARTECEGNLHSHTRSGRCVKAPQRL